MAFTYSRLKETAYLGDTTGTALVEHSSGFTYIRLIILYNSDSSARTVSLYNVPDGAAVGNSHQFFGASLDAAQTVMLEFPAPGIMLKDNLDRIWGKASVASKVTVQIYGATE
jgi:hypothetical protein